VSKPGKPEKASQLPVKKETKPRAVKKANEKISEDRVREVIELLMKSEPASAILQFCSENWGVSDRQVYTYISKAYESIRTHTNKKKSDRLAWHYEIRHKIISDALKQASPYVALSALQDLTKLEGLYPSEKIEAKIQTTHDIAGNKQLKDKFYQFLESGGNGNTN
jgi:hypothetical protein